MAKKWAVLLFLAAIILGPLARATSAQVGTDCLVVVGNFWNPSWIGLPLFNCTSEGPFLENCDLWNYKCPPVAGPSEDCPLCDLIAALAGAPISLASGNTFIKETDVRLPGLGGGLSLVRQWNSLWPATQLASQVGLFGPNWRCNFEERVFIGSDNYIKYARGDGSFWSFGYNTSIQAFSTAAPANEVATLQPLTSGWVITFKSGEQRQFDPTTGRLTKIIDRNGNATQLSYDSIGRLTTVTDPVSRHLNFSYPNGSSFLVSGVTSDSGTGISLAYSYDTQGRITQVTNPDSTYYTFQYNTQSLITTVLDQNGLVLEAHTYDTSNRGLSSTRANSVDSLTISYSN